MFALGSRNRLSGINAVALSAHACCLRNVFIFSFPLNDDDLQASCGGGDPLMYDWCLWPCSTQSAALHTVQFLSYPAAAAPLATQTEAL